MLIILPALFVFFTTHSHHLLKNSFDFVKQKDGSGIHMRFFIDKICSSYIIPGFVNIVCLVFQKKNFHFLSIQYVNSLFSSHQFVFSQSSPYLSPESAEIIISSLLISLESTYPAAPFSNTPLKRKKTQMMLISHI
jgi:hypothetical protein